MKRILTSFQHAFEGLLTLWKEEPNARIHSLAVILVILAGIFFEVNKWEWLMLTLMMGLVITAELFNTAIERIMDHVTPEKHPKVKVIKDLSAAAVLVLALTALVIAGIIFLPKILTALNGLNFEG